MAEIKSSGAAFASDALNSLNLAASRMTLGEQLPEVVALESLTSSMVTTKRLQYHAPSMDASASIPRLGITFAGEQMNMFCGGQNNNDKRFRLLLSTTDKVNFNLYFTEYTDLDHPSFQNRFVKLLRTLSENTTLNIHLGNGVYGKYPIYSFGNIIDAIQRASCKVIIHINGRAGFSESVLWLFAHERVISEFGSLYFSGMQQQLEWYPRWYNFYKFIYDHAVAIGIINQSEMDQLMTTNIDIPILQRDVIRRLQTEMGTPPDSTEQV